MLVFLPRFCYEVLCSVRDSVVVVSLLLSALSGCFDVLLVALELKHSQCWTYGALTTIQGKQMLQVTDETNEVVDGNKID